MDFKLELAQKRRFTKHMQDIYDHLMLGELNTKI